MPGSRRLHIEPEPENEITAVDLDKPVPLTGARSDHARVTDEFSGHTFVGNDDEEASRKAKRFRGRARPPHSRD